MGASTDEPRAAGSGASRSVTRRSGSPATLLTLPETDAFSVKNGGCATQHAVRIIPRHAGLIILLRALLLWYFADGLQKNAAHQLDRMARALVSMTPVCQVPAKINVIGMPTVKHARPGIPASGTGSTVGFKPRSRDFVFQTNGNADLPAQTRHITKRGSSAFAPGPRPDVAHYRWSPESVQQRRAYLTFRDAYSQPAVQCSVPRICFARESKLPCPFQALAELYRPLVAPIDQTEEVISEGSIVNQAELFGFPNELPCQS